VRSFIRICNWIFSPIFVVWGILEKFLVYAEHTEFLSVHWREFTVIIPEWTGIIAPIIGLGMFGWGIWDWRKDKNSKSPPLKIIFDVSNPGNKFWSIEPLVTESGQHDTYWEYRAVIKNNSSKTIRNVKVTVECTGPMPTRPELSRFDLNKKQLIDLNPNEEALVVIRTWYNPPIVVGMAIGEDIYGPIKLTASADDIAPSAKLFHFDPMKTPMVYEFVSKPL
jgi:hypothetical protein